MIIYGINKDSYEAYIPETRLLDGVYLHGILEEKNEFDLVGAKEETYNVLKSCEFGKFEIDVILQNGQKENGFLYYWHDKCGKTHGLITEINDVESIIYAKEMFEKKQSVI